MEKRGGYSGTKDGKTMTPPKRLPPSSIQKSVPREPKTNGHAPRHPGQR
jgi:hypothetical protein